MVNWRRWGQGLGLSLVALSIAGGLGWWLRAPAADWRAAEVSLARGDTADAILRLKAVLVADPSVGPARLLLGRALLRSGDAAGAQAELQRALEAGEGFDVVGPWLGDALIAQGKAAEFLLRLETDKSRPSGELAVRVASALLATGRVDEARQPLAEARRALGDTPAIALVEARLAARSGDAAGALKLLDTLVAQHPDEAAAWGLRADLLRAQPGRADAAVESYRQALARDPRRVEDHASLISLLLQMRRADQARAQWREMAKALPGHGLTDYFDTLLALRETDLPRAREASLRLQRRNGLTTPMLLVAGEAEYRSAGLRQAEALFGKAVAQSPEQAEPRHHLATVLLRLGQPQRALTVLEPLLSATSRDATALGLAGRASVALGRGAEATRLLDRALLLAPDNPALRIDRAQSLARQGQVQRAVEELGRLSEKEEGTAAAMALFRLQMERRDLAAAQAAARSMGARSPQSPLPHGLLAEVALAQGDRRAARQHLDDALGKDGKHLPALLKLAELDQADGDAARSRARLEQVLTVDAGNAPALLGLAQLAGQGSEGEPAMVAWLDRAVQRNVRNPAVWSAVTQRYRSAGLMDRALATAQAAVEALPTDPVVLELLGSVQAELGDRESALRSFRRLGSLLPMQVDTRLQVGRLLRSAGADDEADRMVAEALRQDPKSVDAVAAAVGVALRKKEPDQGLPLARSLQASNPTQALGWLFEGDLEASRQRRPAALAAYAAALKLAQPGPAPMGYHNSLIGAGREAEARQFVDSWLATHPSDGGFRLYLAHRASAAGDRAAAEGQLRALLRAVPDHAVGLNDLAVLLQASRPQEALALAERAVQLQPVVPAFRDTLAGVLQALGQSDKALAEQQRALRLSPRSAELRLHLAQLLLARGEKTSAIRELDELARLDAGFARQPEVAKLRAALGLPEAVGLRAGARPAGEGEHWTGWLARAVTVLLGALAVVAALAAAAAMQPAPIEAKAQRRLGERTAVFAWAQDLRHWPAWSGLEVFGRMQGQSFSTPSSGNGAHYRWESAGRLGRGTAVVLDSVRDAMVSVEFQTEVPVDDRFLWRLSLAPAPDGGTTATLEHFGLMGWWQRLKLLPVGRERWLRRRLAAALERLGAAAQSGPPPDSAAAPDAGPTQLAAKA